MTGPGSGGDPSGGTHLTGPRKESPSRSAPSVTGARAGENPPAVQRWPDSQGDTPVRSSPGPRGLMTGPGSGGDPSGGAHLTGPRKESPSRSAPSVTGARAGENPPAVQRWPDSQGDTPVRSFPGPRGLMTGPGSGGDPSGGAHLNGPQSPPPPPPRPARFVVGFGGGGAPPVNFHRPGTHGANTADRAAWIYPPSMPSLPPREAGIADACKRLSRRLPDLTHR